MGEYYDRAGQPITMEEWVEAFKENSLLRTKVAGDCEVSTVYLGLDHSWDKGPPLIYESLVFGGPMDQHMDRYSTEAEARAGHEALCQRVRDFKKATSG